MGEMGRIAKWYAVRLYYRRSTESIDSESVFLAELQLLYLLISPLSLTNDTILAKIDDFSSLISCTKVMLQEEIIPTSSLKRRVGLVCAQYRAIIDSPQSKALTVRAQGKRLVSTEAVVVE